MTPLPISELKAWIMEITAEAHHGTITRPFEECADPFCVDARAYRDQLLAILDAHVKATRLIIEQRVSSK